ncbi:MAG: hypothetical protein AB1424_00575 [Thermodesulfobacteriota bacterium]
MTARKPQKAKVSKKRPVHTYSELWHGSKILLERAQAEIKGSKWLWMGSLILTAFSFEAYMNHIGPKVFSSWETALEKTLPPESKLEVIWERLEIDLPKNERPRQTVRDLIKFRNNVAHGKTVPIEENTTPDADQYLDEFLGKRPLAIWEEYCTQENALRAREDIEKILQMIHNRINPKNDYLFSFGIGEHSASIKDS